MEVPYVTSTPPKKRFANPRFALYNPLARTVCSFFGQVAQIISVLIAINRIKTDSIRQPYRQKKPAGNGSDEDKTMASDERFKEAIKGKNIPVLTLDNKWHRLFQKTDETREMQELEDKLNELLRRQGKINNEIKELKKLKSNLMDGIVSNMNAAEKNADKTAQKKVAESRRLINEINDKVAAYDDEMLDLPRDIQNTNYELMLKTMELCYGMIQENTSNMESIDEWLKETRIELKRNILKKQHMEIENVELYTYMQDIFGPDVVNLFDIKYDIEGRREALREKQEAAKAEKRRKEAEERARENMAAGRIDEEKVRENVAAETAKDK